MRRMYSKEQLQKLIDEVSRLVAIEELDKVVPAPKLADAGKYIVVNQTGTGYELTTINPISVDGTTIRPTNCYATNEITANSIIENMSGYSWTKGNPSHWTEIFVGVVKNGNKITFVVFGEITKTENTPSGEFTIGQYVLPNSVYSKFYPFTLGDLATFMDAKIISFFSSKTNHVDIPCSARYPSGTNNLNFYISSLANLEVGTRYVFRYELTLLLSDNLVSQE